MEIMFLNGDNYVPSILVGGGNYPKDSREGGNYSQDSRGRGVLNPNNPPYIRHCRYFLSFMETLVFLKTSSGIII